MKARIFAALLIFFIGAESIYAQEMVSLEEAVALGLKKNYDVRLSQNTLTTVEVDNNYAFGAFLPQLNGVASKSWTVSSQEQQRSDFSVVAKDE